MRHWPGAPKNTNRALGGPSWEGPRMNFSCLFFKKYFFFLSSFRNGRKYTYCSLLSLSLSRFHYQFNTYMFSKKKKKCFLFRGELDMVLSSFKTFWHAHKYISYIYIFPNEGGGSSGGSSGGGGIGAIAPSELSLKKFFSSFCVHFCSQNALYFGKGGLK